MAAELDAKWTNSDWLMKLMVALTQINTNVCQENENWLTSLRTVPALSSAGLGKYSDKLYCQYLVGETTVSVPGKFENVALYVGVNTISLYKQGSQSCPHMNKYK